MNKGLIDLHIHTNASDGTDSPEKIVRLAKANNVSAIAITDHDCVDSLLNIEKNDIEIIPGIEFSVNCDPAIHILGLFIDIHNTDLILYLKHVAKIKKIIFLQALRKLQSKNIDVTEILKNKENTSLDKLKSFLKEKKYFSDSEIDKIFFPFLEKWKENLLNADDCIRLIHECNGLAILAHPLLSFSSLKNAETAIKDLVKFGLDGIEVYHSSHSLDEIVMLKKMAENLNILISGGSDYHSNKECIGFITPGKSDSNISICMSSQVLIEMKEKLWRNYVC